MFAASPGLHAVEHPIYDIWLTECKWPDTTWSGVQPDTPKPAPPRRRQKSARRRNNRPAPLPPYPQQQTQQQQPPPPPQPQPQQQRPGGLFGGLFGNN